MQTKHLANLGTVNFTHYFQVFYRKIKTTKKIKQLFAFCMHGMKINSNNSTQGIIQTKMEDCI